MNWLARFLIAVAVMALPDAASAADVRVMISAGFYHVYAELGPEIGRASCRERV